VTAIVEFFDPARPGCWQRFKRGVLGCLGLCACSAVVAAALAARQPMGRYMLGATLMSMGAYRPALAVASSLVDDHPDVNSAFYLLKAAALRHTGDVDGHNRVLDEAVLHFPRAFAANDDRCLYGALFADARAALPYCDQAVALVPPEKAANARAHRGLARALAGDTAGAIDDLDAAVGTWRSTGMTDDQFARPYAEFLEGLRAGRDVFDAETLARERARY
jgi:tetratricopeptide (TPR) repeat protein